MDQEGSGHPVMFGKAWAVLQAGIRAVPATKYTLLTAAFGSSVALVQFVFGGSLRLALVGIAAGILFAIVAVVFARGAEGRTRHSQLAAFLFWSITVLFVATIACLFTSVFFGRPLSLQSWLASNAVLPIVETPQNASAIGLGLAPHIPSESVPHRSTSDRLPIDVPDRSSLSLRESHGPTHSAVTLNARADIAGVRAAKPPDRIDQTNLATCPAEPSITASRVRGTKWAVSLDPYVDGVTYTLTVQAPDGKPYPFSLPRPTTLVTVGEAGTIGEFKLTAHASSRGCRALSSSTISVLNERRPSEGEP